MWHRDFPGSRIGEVRAMGVQVAAYMVNWDELVKRWNQNKKCNDWFFDAVDNGERWVKPYRPADWLESWGAAVDGWQLYEEIRKKLNPAMKKSFDRFLGTFFASDDNLNLKVRDLPDKGKNGVFEVTMSPATVKEYLKLALTLPFKDLEPLLEKYADYPDPDHSHITNFGDFQAYVNQWIGLLQEASKRSKGIVVSAPC